MIRRTTPAPTVVLDLSGRIRHQDVTDYIDHELLVPVGTRRLRAQLDFDKVPDRFQLYLALLDPTGAFRGHVQCPGGGGPRESLIDLSEVAATPGCLPGPIPGGVWTARIDLDRCREDGDFHLRIQASPVIGEDLPEPFTDLPKVRETDPNRDQPTDDRPTEAGSTEDRTTDRDWVRGELHSHSLHSDGYGSVSDLVDFAGDVGLDFLAVSDHFTSSHWSELDRIEAACGPGLPLLLRSIEVTTHRGHSNVHGLRTWPDVYVDRPGHDFSDLAEDVHAQGGIVSVNHPFSGQQAWRRGDVDWSQIDALEVVNQGQGANNDAAIALWDRLLAQGYDIAPVAGTDCHSLADPRQHLGQILTAVRPRSLTSEGILDEVRRCATLVTWGPMLDLRLRSGGTEAGIGERLVAKGPVTIEVHGEVESGATIYVLRDGLMWLQDDVEAGRFSLRVEDRDPAPGAYRVELHRRSSDGKHMASAWRSHESFLALTSHIRVTAVE